LRVEAAKNVPDRILPQLESLELLDLSLPLPLPIASTVFKGLEGRTDGTDGTDGADCGAWDGWGGLGHMEGWKRKVEGIGHTCS